MGNELSNNEAGRGFTHIYTATYEDLQTIGNGGQATIATIPAGGAVEMVGVLIRSVCRNNISCYRCRNFIRRS